MPTDPQTTDLETCDWCCGTGWMSHPDDPAGRCFKCDGKGGVETTMSTERMGEIIDRATTEIEKDVRVIAKLRRALEESVKLQSHYALLLNSQDGGRRMQFASADEWLARLDEVSGAKP